MCSIGSRDVFYQPESLGLEAAQVWQDSAPAGMRRRLFFYKLGVPFVGVPITRALRFGVYIRAPDSWKLSGGHLHCAYNLLLAAADVNHTATSGRTPLQLACEHGRLDIIRLLVRAGADIHKKGIHGGTPLQIACQRGYLDGARLLIRAGADINSTSRYSRTTLQLACEQGHLEVGFACLAHHKDTQGQ